METLLERAGADTARIERLEDTDQAVNLLDRSLQPVIDGKFVDYRFRILTEQTVIVERTDEVLHQFRLAFRQVVFTYLVV